MSRTLIDEQNNNEIIFSSPDFSQTKANLVLAFGERELLESSMPYAKLKELLDSGKALPAGWLEQKIATDSSLLVTAAALRPIAKTNPNQAEEIAQGLQNESIMVGALFGF